MRRNLSIAVLLVIALTVLYGIVSIYLPPIIPDILKNTVVQLAIVGFEIVAILANLKLDSRLDSQISR